MTAAQELAGVLKDARPKYQRTVQPRLTVLRSPELEVGAISTREHTLCGQRDCPKCDAPQRQQLIQRTLKGAELWGVLPCTSCGGPR
jgi:hypothetical protein